MLLTPRSLTAVAILAVCAAALPQYTPEQADWSTFATKPFGGSNTAHDPDGVGWISAEAWEASRWDGTVYNPSRMTKAEFVAAICPSVDRVRGIREVFYRERPFADNRNPTKAEVDEWHRIAINHVRALVGYSEAERQVQKDHCMFLRSLWGQERRFTTQWDAAYPGQTGSAYGPCQGGNNAHCGATFVPNATDQAAYLEPLNVSGTCRTTQGSEGVFGGPKSNIPWSLKWSRGLCNTLHAEGFWGGHVGPWFHREKFGLSFWDNDPSNSNNNAVLRAKWTGALRSNLYCNPANADCDPSSTPTFPPVTPAPPAATPSGRVLSNTSTCADAAGNTYEAGYAQVSAVNPDAYVRKLVANGSVAWELRYDETATDSRGVLCVVDNAGRLWVSFSTDGGSTAATEFSRHRAEAGAFAGAVASGYGQGGGAKVVVVARINVTTGLIERGTYLTSVLTSGNTNTLRAAWIGFDDASGVFELYGTSAAWPVGNGTRLRRNESLTDADRVNGSFIVHYRLRADLSEIVTASGTATLPTASLPPTFTTLSPTSVTPSATPATSSAAPSVVVTTTTSATDVTNTPPVTTVDTSTTSSTASMTTTSAPSTTSTVAPASTSTMAPSATGTTSTPAVPSTASSTEDPPSTATTSEEPPTTTAATSTTAVSSTTSSAPAPLTADVTPAATAASTTPSSTAATAVPTPPPTLSGGEPVLMEAVLHLDMGDAASSVVGNASVRAAVASALKVDVARALSIPQSEVEIHLASTNTSTDIQATVAIKRRALTSIAAAQVEVADHSGALASLTGPQLNETQHTLQTTTGGLASGAPTVALRAAAVTYDGSSHAASAPANAAGNDGGSDVGVALGVVAAVAVVIVGSVAAVVLVRRRRGTPVVSDTDEALLSTAAVERQQSASPLRPAQVRCIEIAHQAPPREYSAFMDDSYDPVSSTPSSKAARERLL